MRKIEIQSVINDQNIRVASENSNTLFVDIHNFRPILLSDLKAKVKELRARCRVNKVSFSVKRIKLLLESFADYEAAVVRHKELYSTLKSQWEEIVSEGIYAPTVSNEKINLDQKERATIEALSYRSSPLSKVHAVEWDLNKYLHQDLSNYTKIAL